MSVGLCADRNISVHYDYYGSFHNDHSGPYVHVYEHFDDHDDKACHDDHNGSYDHHDDHTGRWDLEADEC